MKKSVVVLLHIGFWLCYLFFILIVVAVHYNNVGDVKAQETLIENAFKNLFFFAIFPSAVSFYLYYFLLFPRYLQQKKYILSIVIGITISLFAAIIGFILLRYSIDTGKCQDMDKKGTSTFWGVMIFMTFIGTITGVVALVIRACITWFEEIKLKEMLKQKTNEMELALIKAQLDPHFLFNTINNIDVLILKDANEASNYLNKLSDILRFMLYETKSDSILLSKELEYIDKYVELQKIRTNNQHYVQYSVSGAAYNKSIAPMVFIPFIENAFKHTNNKKVENAITINIIIKEETTEFVCENKFSVNSKMQEESNGLGNELIRKRLNLIYPDKHTLEVTNENDLYSVHLTIKNG
jgi:two-component system, LytTR family, sensor kinase